MSARDAAGRGVVSLVGAGPGDPGLLTVRGRRLIEEADVVLYDHLASPSVLAAVDVPGQERIHVGKAGGLAFSEQEQINALMIKRAQAGQRVVRLKGGDPFVFGRGAEECEALAAAGVRFEVVSGVTSAHAVPAAAGIPLTHRDVASAFTVVTGHEKDPDAARVDWARVGQDGGTVVVLMGVKQVARWSEGLVRGGRAAGTPVALVRWGTLARQAVVTTTLGEAAAAARGLSSPIVAVVGEVVRLREVLAWRERLPLMGQVIGLTREADDEASFEALDELGAALYHLPLTRKQPTENAKELDDRLRAGGFTDLVFTSANGVQAFRAALERAGLDARALAGVRTWAVGPATAKAMRDQLALVADEVPARATADDLVALARERGVAGRRFLFPAAAGARRVLPDGLAALGAVVHEVACYETVPEPTAPARLVSALEEGLTLLTVASPSACAALAGALDAAGAARDTVPLAAIGPTTAAAARDLGFDVRVVPERYRLDALAEAIAAAAREGRLGPVTRPA